MTTNVLILGVNGMLGSMLVRRWSALDELRLFAGVRNQVSPSLWGRLETVLQGIDATEFCKSEQARLAGFMRTHAIDAVVNCMGVIKQRAGGQDPLIATSVNALFPHQLARVCDEGEVRLLHVSTDCVFSGAAGGYLETDPPDATDFYGRSKALGEVGTPHLTLRTSIIGPELEGSEGLGLLAWFLRQKGPTVPGFTRALFSGVTTLALADLLERILIAHPALAGLYQVASSPIDKYSLLRKVNETFQLGVEVVPDSALEIDRSLNSEKLRATIGYSAPSWDAQLAALQAHMASNS